MEKSADNVLHGRASFVKHSARSRVMRQEMEDFKQDLKNENDNTNTNGNENENDNSNDKYENMKKHASSRTGYKFTAKNNMM